MRLSMSTSLTGGASAETADAPAVISGSGARSGPLTDNTIFLSIRLEVRVKGLGLVVRVRFRGLGWG